ncbi:hypothetical protein BpHYR1_000939 [Brachionus plicatilis]|uniref:Uncharacterized protein n=1 Tax=Brachionus plicatilis TaxID=10195 RepID=A0A3M7RBK5_BRAPC|nr:hypothetical protein BpHYR1_000939 [Brachionus plicatilis]
MKKRCSIRKNSFNEPLMFCDLLLIDWIIVLQEDIKICNHIERSEVLRMEFLFIPICSCQEHELIIKSRCELNA